MNIYEVQNLEANQASIRKIQEFLTKPLAQSEYVLAYIKLFQIQMEMGQLEHAYQHIHRFLETTIVQSAQELSEVYTVLIDVCFMLDQDEEAYRHITTRHTMLQVMDQYKTTLDMIKYKKKHHEPFIEDVYKIQQDAIPVHVLVYTHQLIYEYLKEEKQYDKALAQLQVLYQYDLKIQYQYDELELLMVLNDFSEMRKKGEKLHKQRPDDLTVVYYLIFAYQKLNLFGKIEVLDANYEALFKEAPLELQKKFYELMIAIYKQEDNHLSLNHYQSQLKQVTKQLQKAQALEREKAFKTEELKQEVETIALDIKQTADVIEAPQATLPVAQTLEYIQSWMLYAYQLDLKLPLREYLRQFFIQIDRVLKCSDYVVYIKDATPNFFHYKMERLYDKMLLDTSLKHTLIEDVMYQLEDVFGSGKGFKDKINPVQNKPYTEDIGYIFALPIADIGVFMVYLKEEIQDPALYMDLFKGVVSIIYSRLIVEKHQESMKKNMQYMQYVLNHPALSMRDITPYHVVFNSHAQDMLDVNKHLPLELFIKEIRYDKVHMYEQTIKRLFAHPQSDEKLYYHYKNLDIFEHLYSVVKDDEVHIISFFYDQSKLSDENRRLFLKATQDDQTGLANRYAFEQNADSYLEHKVSFLLIELDTSLQYIYGTASMQLYFKEFSQWIKKHFETGTTYRFYENQVLVVVPFNDIRTITQTIQELYKKIQEYKIISIPYQPFNCHIGIVRYPVVTTEKNMSKIYTYLDIALSKAKRSRENKYHFFLYKDYETESFEQSVIQYLNEAIEAKQMDVVFYQITDIKNQFIWQYESELVLPNMDVDGKYLYQLAQKRNRLIDFERFHIETVCQFLHHLKNETKHYIKITIPISKETLMDPQFTTYLFSVLKTYDIPAEFIRLKCDAFFKTQAYVLCVNELINAHVGLDTTSVEMAMMYDFQAVHLENKKGMLRWGTYLKHVKALLDAEDKQLVIRGIQSKEEKDKMAKLGIQYIEGSLYKRFTKDKLIQKVKESVE